MLKLKKYKLLDIILTVLIIALFEPVGFVKNSFIHLICQFLTVVTVVSFSLALILRKNRVSKMLFVTILYSIFVIITSVFNNSYEISVMRVMLSIVGIALFFEYFTFDKSRRIILNSFFGLLVFNLLVYYFDFSIFRTIIGDDIWFLAGDNALIIYCFPAMSIAIASIEVKTERLKAISTVIMSLYIVILSGAATSAFVLVMLTIVWYLQKNNLLKISLKWAIILVIVIFILVAIMRVQNNNLFIKYIIENILQRDLTFTSRTFIWKESVKQILAAPIFGHGFRYSFYVPVFATGFWADHAHNHFLQQMIQGGIIQLFLFVMLLAYMIKGIVGLPRNKINWIICSIAMMGILFIFESYTNAMIYSVFFIVDSYSYNIREYKDFDKLQM